MQRGFNLKFNSSSGEEKLQAVLHVDGTARLQTVNSEIHPLLYNLIAAFDRLTGVPTVLKTSFNARGEPIVETPLDALATFTCVGMDALFFLDRILLQNQGQPEK